MLYYTLLQGLLVTVFQFHQHKIEILSIKYHLPWCMVHCVPSEVGWVGEGGYVYLCLEGVGWGKGGMFISEVAWVGKGILACTLKNQFQSTIFLMRQWCISP